MTPAQLRRSELETGAAFFNEADHRKLGEEYEHRIHRNQHRSNREFAAPHLRDLSQRSEIRVPEKPAPSRLHRVRTELPAYVLRSFRPGAEFESEHWEHARNDVPACDLRHLRR